MRLERVLTPKKRVKKGNEGDQESIPLFAACALSLMMADARQAGQIGPMADYARATVRWFDRVAPMRPFPFQSKTHRESDFRKGMASVLNRVIAGLVAGDRRTTALIAELQAAADQYLADFVLSGVSSDAQTTSMGEASSFCRELRSKRSIARLLTDERFEHFCESAQSFRPHERRLRLAGIIARELFA